ncbi:hypothetical protein I544_0003 [Mycobacteroides abscessus subsp. bolletii 103]|nr:hypothetical protein I544_0003 [Mycobacteroides abscessus subsp. bolletii 103]
MGIGAGTLLAMNRFLNTQLDEQVRDAGNRSVVNGHVTRGPGRVAGFCLRGYWRGTLLAMNRF